MARYINADRLMAEVEKHITEVKGAGKRLTPNMGFFDAKLSGIYDVMSIIDSLQQKQSEEPIPNDLEEAAEEAATGLNLGSHLRFIEGFKAGAKWDREQMMKEAVEGEVVKDISNKLAVTAKINLDGFKFGDKVHIVIVKED